MNLHRVIRADRAVVGGRERSAAIGISDGRIVVVGERDAPLDATHEIVVPEGRVVLPGLVDTHVHVNEPGRTEWEGFATATQAAAAGGVTTIVDMPLNSVPPTTTVDALEQKRDTAWGQTFVDVGFWGGAVPGNLPDIAKLHDAGVFGFKCFLIDSGVEEFPPLDAQQFAAAMAETARLGALLIVHAEDADVIAGAPPAEGTAYGTFLRSRPPEAEQHAIARVIAAACETGGRAHVLHLSSAGALGQLQA
ncbi:MAG TPA: amidohydrolase family protein, partial [Jatrophihabitans sp.]|nr:amidohydrolase family protein [Jatrophihabitans sp.]